MMAIIYDSKFSDSVIAKFYEIAGNTRLDKDKSKRVYFTAANLRSFIAGAHAAVEIITESKMDDDPNEKSSSQIIPI